MTFTFDQFKQWAGFNNTMNEKEEIEQARVEQKEADWEHERLFAKPIPFTLADLQEEVIEWSRKNFPNNQSYHPLLGLMEEVGELSHAHLKSEQGIRGDIAELYAQKVDAVADIIIYLADYCARNNISLHSAVVNTWAKVKQRDWTKNKQNGEVPL